MRDLTSPNYPVPRFAPKKTCLRGVARRCLPFLAVLSVVAAALISVGGDATAAAPTLNSPQFAPLGNVTVPRLIGRIISGILAVTGALALAMFVYGGIMWMTSQGNTDRVTKAKNTIIWSILGLLLIFTSYTLVEFILRAMGQ